MSMQTDLGHVQFATELTGVGIQPAVMLLHVIPQLALIWQKTYIYMNVKQIYLFFVFVFK